MDGRDPILVAYRWCSTCRAESYPLDAIWLGPDLLLVAFEPLCRHHTEPLTQIVRASAVTLAEARCAGLTAAGARCRARPAIGGEFCRHHDPSRRGARR